MPTTIKQRTEIEDLHGKRGLLDRYAQSWERELSRTDLTPKQRAQIARDLDTLRGIDEDMLRAEKLLQRHKTSDNPELRDRIVQYIADSEGAEVTLGELCSHFGASQDRMRGLLRPLRASGHVHQRGKGYVLGKPLTGVLGAVARAIGSIS